MKAHIRYKILIDGRWDIRDLHSFPHRYAEVYSFLYALNPINPEADLQLKQIFQRYPWGGGFSAVNFYDNLYRVIPNEDRPTITRITYASPGFIELAAVAIVVSQIDKIFRKVVSAWNFADSVYDRIHKRAMARKLLRLKVKDRERKLTEKEITFAIEATKELADAIGIENLDLLRHYAQDPLGELKILLAFYRRLRELQTFIEEGKVRLDADRREDMANEDIDS